MPNALLSQLDLTARAFSRSSEASPSFCAISIRVDASQKLLLNKVIAEYSVRDAGGTTHLGDEYAFAIERDKQLSGEQTNQNYVNVLDRAVNTADIRIALLALSGDVAENPVGTFIAFKRYELDFTEEVELPYAALYNFIFIERTVGAFNAATTRELRLTVFGELVSKGSSKQVIWDAR